ncbi:phage terminase large subunit, partial [Vibrio sp.]|uniref:phage terminase large subunit n=1 Tax=Vibrio sp. TaxID=678 RepID=UPI002579DAF8
QVEGTIGNMKPSEKEPTMLLVEKLEPAILKHKKYKCFYGGRGGMKTRFAQNAMVSQVHSSGCKTYALRERMTALKESIYSGIETTVKNSGFGGFRSVPSKWEIRNANAGKFVFGGMQNILDMKGAADFKFFLMEEAEKTKQNTIDTLGPTLRDTQGAELWYLWNTGSSQDPMSKEFILPYQSDLDKCGYYEDEYHMIFFLTYQDNPWFEHDESLRSELDKDKHKVKNGIMSQNRFNGIWLGAFNDFCADSIIQVDWLESCLDGHKKLGIEARGTVVAGVDPSDVGSDPFGYAKRVGRVFTSLLEVEGENGNRKMDEACKIAKLDGVDVFAYETDGLGATLRDNVSNGFAGKTTKIVPYKAGSACHKPDDEYKNSAGFHASSRDKLLNKDVFRNKKAQNIIKFAEAVYLTHQVVKGEVTDYDEEDLIFFDSESIKPEFWQKFKAEASKMPVKPSSTIEFYKKSELRKGIVLADGSRLQTDSPNILDSVIVTVDDECIINLINDDLSWLDDTPARSY